MSVCAVVPYAYVDAHRDRLFNYVLEYLAEMDLEVEIGTASNFSGPASFNHPEAINTAVARVNATVVMIVDADTLPLGQWVDAIQRVAAGEWPWSMPERYVKLNEGTTNLVLEGEEIPFEPTLDEVEWVGERVSWAGVQIIRRDMFFKTGGWDERFAGWGSDDVCFGLASDTLVGKHARFAGSATHLWHQQNPNESFRHENWEVQQKITEDYLAACDDQFAMKTLLEERDRTICDKLEEAR